MGIISRFLKLFRKAGGKPARRDLSGLSKKLGEMRGDNITVVDSGDNLPPNRDGIENLAAPPEMLDMSTALTRTKPSLICAATES